MSAWPDADRASARCIVGTLGNAELVNGRTTFHELCSAWLYEADLNVDIVEYLTQVSVGHVRDN
jgi:hypothetical protein